VLDLAPWVVAAALPGEHLLGGRAEQEEKLGADASRYLWRH
jgi:hypothetical protein